MRRLLVFLASAAALVAVSATPLAVAAPAGASTAKFDAVTVTGAAGERPVVTVNAPFDVKTSTVDVINPGKGVKASKGSTITFDYASESDRVGYPIPTNPKIEGGGTTGSGDRHILMVDKDACRLYELFAARKVGSTWYAGSGATWDLRSNKLRPAGWTSADAAGLPILPGLVRYDEVAAGAIRHALRFTTNRTRKAYVYPARHYASDSTSTSLPPMGLRVRLKASYDTSRFSPHARAIAEALADDVPSASSPRIR